MTWAFPRWGKGVGGLVLTSYICKIYLKGNVAYKCRPMDHFKGNQSQGCGHDGSNAFVCKQITFFANPK